MVAAGADTAARMDGPARGETDPNAKPLDVQPLDSLRQVQEQLQRAAVMTPSANMLREPVSESPKVAGYSFVPSTPSLVPGVDATPLRTWVRMNQGLGAWGCDWLPTHTIVLHHRLC